MRFERRGSGRASHCLEKGKAVLLNRAEKRRIGAERTGRKREGNKKRFPKRIMSRVNLIDREGGISGA